MISQKIQTIITIRSLDHHNTIHRRILTFERHLCPLCHDLCSLFHRFSCKVHEFNITVFFVYHILIPVSLFVSRKTNTHAFTALICFINRLLQHIPVQIRLNRQTGSNIENFLLWTEILVKEMKFLSCGQWIYRISVSFSHHLIIPPINSVNIFS